MLRILFEWLEFAFKFFESFSNVSNLDLNTSNPFRMVRIWIPILQIPFEWHSNASNLFQIVKICIRMPQIPFEWLEFALEFF